MITQKAADEINKLKEEWSRNDKWEKDAELQRPQTRHGMNYKWNLIRGYTDKKRKISERIEFIRQTGYSTSELARLKQNLGKGRQLQQSERGGHRHGYVYADEFTEVLRDDKTGFEGIVKYKRYPYSGQVKKEIIKMRPLPSHAVQKLIEFGPKVNPRRREHKYYNYGRRGEPFDFKPLKAPPVVREPNWGDFL